jgi:serine/threonine-protein kinase
MILPDGYFLQYKKYQLTHTIGQGGFGITYLGVWNTEVKGELGKMKTTVPVCVKEYFFKDYCYREKDSYAVKVHSVTGEKLFGRFKEKLIKEANILSAVHHPNIVNVLEVFEENNTAYIIMEYIKGCSLKYMLEKEGVLPENKVLKYTHQVGNALAFVHEKNIVHLDIKPGNILIDQNDNARLIDFGVSKRYDIEEQETSTTTLTLSKGFASIEQYDDEGTQTFSPCPDVYSLGATMYNLLTGVVPIESILRATKQLLPLSDYNSNVTPKTEKAILKAMEIKPEDRFRSVKEMLAAIDVPVYELAENKLVEKTQREGDDHTEAVNAAGALPTGQTFAPPPQTTDDDDQTIVTSSIGEQKKSKPSGSKGKSKRKTLMIVSALFCALIGYAVYSYFSDGLFSMGAFPGIQMPGDSLTQAASGVNNQPDDTLTISQPDDASSDSESQTQSDNSNSGQSRTDEQPQGQQMTPLSTTTNDAETSTRSTTGQTTGRPNDVSQVRIPQNASVSDGTSDTESARGNEGGAEAYTEEELDSYKNEYSEHLSAGKAKMESRDYAGALEYLRKAAKIAESTRIKSMEEEVDFFIKTCTEKIEEKEREERRKNYELYYPLGNKLKVARNNKTTRYGAVDADWKDVIPCIYVMVDRLGDSYFEFQREDGLVDVYDNEGELKSKGVLPSVE